MNIFVLDTDPAIAAAYHCDQHVVKMILESAQMLCTALHIHGVATPYKPTHMKHPCTIWAAETHSNWLWLRQLAHHLNIEFKKRYQKEANHKSWDIIESLDETPIPSGPLTPFVQAMPDQYKPADPVTAYRQFYREEKASFAQWLHTKTPAWIFITSARENA